MTEHEHEIAAQVAVDVISGYLDVLPPEALDDLKRLILTKLHERFEFSPDDIDWGDVEP